MKSENEGEEDARTSRAMVEEALIRKRGTEVLALIIAIQTENVLNLDHTRTILTVHHVVVNLKTI